MAPWLGLLLIGGVSPPPITLSYFQQNFIVRDGAFNESAPLRIAPKPPKLATVFRRNSTFAVWDERGLTLRVGKKIQSTKLPLIPVSPRIFSRAEILRTQSEIKKGRRSRDASGCAGAVRVANRVYFLARWSAKDAKPWAEAMISVDLADKNAKPKLLDRIPELSLANAPIDDMVFILDGKPSYVARSATKWGIAQLDLKSGKLSFAPVGDRLASFLPFDKPSLGGRFVEFTSYGTTLAGTLNLPARRRETVVEGRGNMHFLDGAEPPVVIVSNGKQGAWLVGGETGAERDLPASSAARRCSRGIIVWTPAPEPKKAWLFDPGDWRPLAWWSATP